MTKTKKKEKSTVAKRSKKKGKAKPKKLETLKIELKDVITQLRRCNSDLKEHKKRYNDVYSMGKILETRTNCFKNDKKNLEGMIKEQKE